jgi:Leucine-rich repeat (LRR) protein
MNLDLACSMVENDEDAVTSDIFTIPLNPISTDSISYGWTDDNGHIHHLKIIDKKFISPMIFRLKYLKRLEIRNACFFSCDLRQVPPDIQCLASSLIDLGIYDTKITHLPNEIGKLERLQILQVSNTSLISLPNTIKNLRSLQQIILTNNPYLHSIEPLNGLPSLRILDTSRCSIEFLPKNLPQLTDLYMSNNKLKKLIGLETLGNGTKAEKYFRFDMNYIDFVSPTIRHVKNLVRLTLNDNRLKSLPLDIFEIPTLQRLFYHNNSLNDNELKKLSMKFNNSFRSKSKN